MPKDDDAHKDILLKAAYNLLRKCNYGPIVTNPLVISCDYGDEHKDGFDLANDIAALLGLEKLK